jgi:hypothetical protein
LARQSETVRPDHGFWVGGIMRIVVVAALVAMAGFSLSGTGVLAQTAPSGVRMAQAATPTASEASPQRRRLRRVPIYRPGSDSDVIPRYNPGPNAVRSCTATYVQEYRPSGTVITPRMNCYWRRG